jgi:hypothetical protein
MKTDGFRSPQDCYRRCILLNGQQTDDGQNSASHEVEPV